MRRNAIRGVSRRRGFLVTTRRDERQRPAPDLVKREFAADGPNRDSIFAPHLDDSIRALGVEVLRSPVASPKANSICERVIGTIRRECLDWMLPMSEAHLRSILRDWVTHYNGGRPHSALGPGVPGPPREAARVSKFESRHQLAGGRDRAREIGAGRVTSRVSDCSGASGGVVGLGHPSDIQPQWAISP